MLIFKLAGCYSYISDILDDFWSVLLSGHHSKDGQVGWEVGGWWGRVRWDGVGWGGVEWVHRYMGWTATTSVTTGKEKQSFWITKITILHNDNCLTVVWLRSHWCMTKGWNSHGTLTYLLCDKYHTDLIAVKEIKVHTLKIVQPYGIQ